MHCDDNSTVVRADHRSRAALDRETVRVGHPSTRRLDRVGGNELDPRLSVLSAAISYPQIRRTSFGRERLRSRKDAHGAVRTP
jgi:hypothetical protein